MNKKLKIEDVYRELRLADAKRATEVAREKKNNAIALFFQVAASTVLAVGIAYLLNGFFL